MDVKKALFMNKGDGETSYAQNSFFTQKVTAICKPVIQNAINSLFSEDFPSYTILKVADLGCASGPNTFSVMETVIESVERKCEELKYPMPAFQLCFNDLYGNDFNTLLKGLYSFEERYNHLKFSVMVVPGSFHRPLFLPRNSLHLSHSSYSVHWLSKVPRLLDKDGLPLNKGKIYISKTSPPAVREAYLAQFQEDFDLFLKSRSEEMASDGRLILILNGRESEDPTDKESCYRWELLAEAVADLVAEGLIPEEKLDSFDVPYYMPSQQEMKDAVDREGSFAIELLDTFAIPVEIGDKGTWKNVETYTTSLRSFTESMFSYHFGMEKLDKLYEKLTHILTKDLATNTEPVKTTSIVLVLRRNLI